MKLFYVLLSCTVSLTLIKCSSAPRTAENSEDRVLSRIDDLSSRPGWLKEGEPFRVDGGAVSSLGSTKIPSDHRVEAAFRIAENNAKANICNAIEQRLEMVLQNAEEGTAQDTAQARYIGAEACKITTSSIRTQKRYWEKVATTKDSGERVTEYHVFASVQMPESDFKRAVMDAIRAQQGKGSISADFGKKVDQQWDRFVEGRKPASE